MRDRLGDRIAIDGLPQPEFQIDKRPQSLRMIFPTGIVFGYQMLQHIVVQDAALAHSLSEDALVDYMAKLSPKPCSDGDRKAHLRPRQDLPWQNVLHRSTQDVFCRPATELHSFLHRLRKYREIIEIELLDRCVAPEECPLKFFLDSGRQRERQTAANQPSQPRRCPTMIGTAKGQVVNGCPILSVPCQQFVAAFPSQDDLDVLGCEFRNKIERDACYVSDRLVFLPNHPRQGGKIFLGRDDDLVMICSVCARNDTRELQLVGLALGKGDRKGLDWPFDKLAHHR